MALNDSRELAYAFRVFVYDGFAWLFDDSAREYPCTSRAHITVEMLYDIADGETDEVDPNVTMFLASMVERLQQHEVPLDPDDVAMGVTATHAWDAAREEAHANHLV